MLITEADITVESGRGGDGLLSFFHGNNTGPDGGNGGNGGSIYFIAIDDIFGLTQFFSKSEFKAGDGFPGGYKKHDGQAGKDVIIKVPVGTVVTIEQSGQTINVLDKKEPVKVLRGGYGGRGNYALRFRSSTKDNYYEKGKPGKKLELHLEMKLVADYGLVGLPNAGKSSLINELTRANAKVGSYPFTTIEPNIGKLDDIVIADIPGLIEGASEGKGLGIKFLKHIEKIGLLLHCVACDSEDIVKDYEVVCKEIKDYKRQIAEKDKIILLTKTDMVSPKEFEEKKKLMGKYGYPVYGVSIHDWEALQGLKEILKRSKLDE